MQGECCIHRDDQQEVSDDQQEVSVAAVTTHTNRLISARATFILSRSHTSHTRLSNKSSAVFYM